MKKLISVMSILLLLITVSACAKKADGPEPRVDVATDPADNDVKDADDETQKNDDVTSTDKDDSEKQATENDSETEDNQNQEYDTEKQQDTVAPPVDNDIKGQPDAESEAEADAESKDEHDAGTEENNESDGLSDLLTLERPNKRFAGYYSAGGSHWYYIEHNNDRFFYYSFPVHFPQNTIYEDVDLTKLTATGKTVTVNWYSAGELAQTHHTEQVEVYDLPDNMKNDPYINMFAVNFKGSIKLFFSPDITYNEGDKFYREFLIDNRLCGHQCLNAKNITEILLTTYNGSKATQQALITNPSETAKLFDMLSELPYSASVTKECKNNPADLYLNYTTVQIKFKDGSGFDLRYQHDQKAIGTFIPYAYYKATPEFGEYLFSLLK